MLFRSDSSKLIPVGGLADGEIARGLRNEGLRTETRTNNGRRCRWAELASIHPGPLPPCHNLPR